MFEEIVLTALHRIGWDAESTLNYLLQGKLPWRLLIYIVLALIIEFIFDPFKHRRIKVKLTFKKYIPFHKSKAGIYVTNLSENIIEGCSAQLYTIQQPNRRKPTELNLPLVWAENGKGEINLQRDKTTLLHIAEGRLRENYANLISRDGEERHFDIGVSVIVIRFFGQVGIRSIVPVSQTFNLLNGGDGVFDIEEI